MAPTGAGHIPFVATPVDGDCGADSDQELGCQYLQFGRRRCVRWQHRDRDRRCQEKDTKREDKSPVHFHILSLLRWSIRELFRARIAVYIIPYIIPFCQYARNVHFSVLRGLNDNYCNVMVSMIWLSVCASEPPFCKSNPRIFFPVGTKSKISLPYIPSS